jgi:hypothetical protein
MQVWNARFDKRIDRNKARDRVSILGDDHLSTGTHERD